MTIHARLIIAKDLERPDDIYAIDLGSKVEAVIDRTEARNFFVDCVGLDPSLAADYSAGRCIQTNMSAQDGASWTNDAYEIVTPLDYVALTVCPEANGAVGGLCLADSREAIAPADELAYFSKDCGRTWNAEAFNAERSFVALMAADDWASWLERYEVEA